jgi:hypothetical protein
MVIPDNVFGCDKEWWWIEFQPPRKVHGPFRTVNLAAEDFLKNKVDFQK